MADLDKTKEELEGIREEFGFLENSLKSLANVLSDSLAKPIEGLSDDANKLAKSLGKDIANAAATANKQLKNQEDLINSINKGVNVEKKIQNEIAKVQKNRTNIQRKIKALKLEGVKVNEEEITKLEGQLDAQEEILNAILDQNQEKQKSKSLITLASDAMKDFADEIDKSGTLSKLLSGNFEEVLSLARLGQLALIAIGSAILKGSENMAKLAQTTGISKDAAFELQKSLNQAALDSGNVAFTGEKATKAFVALSKETGLVADFGGQTLETFSMLTTKLGLAENAASSLTTMARLQGKETEKILSDTVATASSLAKQAGVGLNVKGVLEDVASASNSIKVSLGSNPEFLAEAATNAALLGTNLAGVDAIASSLLDFETSIKNELAAEQLLGADINLEKARQLALTNDLAGLSEEIANQEEITASFANGNRIQQEAAAAALGLSRDALADMVMKQQLNALSAEEFKNTYGEATYEQMQSVSAQEKLALSFGKLKDSIAQIGLAFAPFLDAVAKAVSFVFSMKETLVVLGGLLAGLAARQAILAAISLKKSIFEIFAGNSKFGPVGIAASIAGVGAMMALANTETVDDAVIPPGYGQRIMSGPKGSIAFNDDDTIVAGTNLGGGGNSMKETNALLNQILNKQGTVKMNATSVGTAFSVNSRQIQ